LTRALGSFELAEDAVQDALVKAAQRWPVDGIPEQPGAWLTTVARNAAVDRIRREAVGRRKLAQLDASVPPVAEDRLRLIFACCHPALAREAQLGLTLRAVCGFTNAQIAAALLVGEAAIAQRLARAKRKLAEGGIAFRLPAESETDERLREVLAVLYLMFNEGYLSSTSRFPERRDFADDAAWLAALVTKLYPRNAEALGLLALMRLHQARRPARFAGDGSLILLADQDRSLWDRGLIREGTARVEEAARLREPGAYQLQAAIVACHAEAERFADTDWPQILALYDLLLGHDASPVVRLNRAIALWQVAGPAVALDEVEALEPLLAGYHLFHATRGRLLIEIGERELASAAELKAERLTSNPAEQALLRRRLQEVH
jgi:RNA polymerase sigma factor (sigma-70 family)